MPEEPPPLETGGKPYWGEGVRSALGAVSPRAVAVLPPPSNHLSYVI